MGARSYTAFRLPVSERPALTQGHSSPPAEEYYSDGLRTWWVRALTLTSTGYILASQGLTFFSGWSRVGFLIAVLQLALLGAGVALKMFRFQGLGWVWLGLSFFAFALLRSIPQPGDEWHLQVLFQMLSAFSGGAGVALALQSGVSFRAIAYAQAAIFLANIVAGALGMGTEAPAEAEPGRAAGLTGNANELAMQLTMGACLIWMFPKRAGALACSLAVAAVAYAVATTGSRKGLFALGCFALLAGIQLFTLLKGRRWILLLAVPPAIAAAAIAAPLAFQKSKGLVTVQRTLDLQDHSMSLRVGMARQATRLWSESPIVGWGTDAFSRISGFGVYAHNNFAELLCDLGIVGTLLFYSLHLYIILKLLRWPMPARLYGLVFVCMIIAMDFASVSYTRKQTIMILMILAAVVNSRLGLVAEKGLPAEPGQRRFDWPLFGPKRLGLNPAASSSTGSLNPPGQPLPLLRNPRRRAK